MTVKRIVLVTAYFATHRGGIERVAEQLASRLAARGYGIDWFASDTDPAASIPGITAHPMPAWNALERIGLPWPIWSPRALVRLGAAVKQCDVVHIHDYMYCGSIAAWLFAKRYRKPVVITQHTNPANACGTLLKPLLRVANWVLAKPMLTSARQAIFISPAIRAQYGLSDSLYWPNGVDTSVFHPVDDTQKRQLRVMLDVAAEQKIFLFVGRFVKRKGMREMQALARAMPDAQWWFAGWGEAGQVHPVNWNLPNVRLFEGRSGKSLALLYQAADVLVLPSYSEGFPLVVQEAIACGLPVAVSSQTLEGAPDASAWMSHASLAPEHFIARWREMLQNIDTREAYRKDLAAFAAENWPWDKIADHYDALFMRC